MWLFMKEEYGVGPQRHNMIQYWLQMIKKSRMNISCFEMTDLGWISYFLGIEVVQQNDEIFISQKKYKGDVLNKLKMEHSKPISTSVEEKLKLPRENDGNRVDSTQYKSFIENLRYLTATRSNIIYGFGLLNRFIEESHISHLQGEKRILLDWRYFYANNNDVKFVGYTDSDWQTIHKQEKTRKGMHFI